MKEAIKKAWAAFAALNEALSEIEHMDPEAGYVLDQETGTAVEEIEEALAYLEKTWST